MEINLVGFHGTNKQNVSNILAEGFKPSQGDDHWLGDGSYFFIDGLNRNPQEQAKKWAITEAWNTFEKNYRYSSYAVIRSLIYTKEQNFLDLTTPDGVEVLEFIYNQCLAKLKCLKSKSKVHFVDGLLINFARKEGLCEIDVVKGNFYIKLNAEDRILRKLSRRTPNCTICAVYSPEKSITDLEVVMEGDINYETDL